MAKLRVSKIGAARRQIAAIRLLFDNGDPVPIHTLAAAGWRILRDLCERQGTPHHQAVKAAIRPGMEPVAWQTVNSAANFFKHADKDAGEILDGVYEEVNDAVLLMAVMSYADLGHQLTSEMRALSHWFSALHPDTLDAAVPQQDRALLGSFDWLHLPRAEQLAEGKKLLQPMNHVRAGI
jgi:hypothetical protein